MSKYLLCVVTDDGESEEITMLELPACWTDSKLISLIDAAVRGQGRVPLEGFGPQVTYEHWGIEISDPRTDAPWFRLYPRRTERGRQGQSG